VFRRHINAAAGDTPRTAARTGSSTLRAKLTPRPPRKIGTPRRCRSLRHARAPLQIQRLGGKHRVGGGPRCGGGPPFGAGGPWAADRSRGPALSAVPRALLEAPLKATRPVFWKREWIGSQGRWDRRQHAPFKHSSETGAARPASWAQSSVPPSSRLFPRPEISSSKGSAPCSETMREEACWLPLPPTA